MSKIWNPDTGAMVYDLTRHGQPVYSLSANPEGSILTSLPSTESYLSQGKY